MLWLSPLSFRAAWPCRNRTCLSPAAFKLFNCKPTLPRCPLHRGTNTISTAPIDNDVYIGQPGRSYKFQRILQKETFPQRRVCLATAGDQTFMLKYIHKVNFEDLQDINRRLYGGTSHVRLAQDTIPEKSMYVFEYFAEHIPHLIEKDLPVEVIKQILKDALRGIAELHDRNIVHTDIKADNVFLDWKNHHFGTIIE